MSNEMWNDEELNAVMTRVLEERREVAIPESFAARVCSNLPAQAAVQRRVDVGQTIAMVMAVIALSAVFLLAARAPMSFGSLAFDVECVLMLQLAAIMYWLAVRRAS